VDSPLKMNHVIKFVADMDRAVRFYRDAVGLPLKFQSPEWSEFATGETTLALHPANDRNKPGTVELGFTVPDTNRFYEEMNAKGVHFSIPPAKQEWGRTLAQFDDSEGAHCSVSSNSGG